MMNNNEHKARIMADLFMLTGVPYKVDEHEDQGAFMGLPQIQITFPWCDGDVIMYACNLEDPKTSSVVESYNFPWDEDDVTRDYPEEMAWRIIAYYFDIPFEIE